MESQKIKVGLLINDYNIPAWEYHLVKQINESPHSEISLIVRKLGKQNQKESTFQKLWKIRGNFLYFLHGKIESKLFKPKKNAFTPKDLNKIVNCPEILVNPKETKFSDIISDEDVSKIKSEEIDVLLRFGFRILRGGILKSAKYGIWSFHHGDNAVNRGGPPGVWEVYNNWDETGAILQILTEDLDGGLTLAKTFSSTDPKSLIRNKNSYYWNACSMVIRKLNELHSKGGDIFMEEVQGNNNVPQFYYNRLFVTPKNRETLKSVFRIYHRIIIGWIKRRFFFNQWILLFKFEKKRQLSKSFWRFKRIVPPKDRFWADPFPIEKNGKYYIFFEELIYKNGLGNISVLELDEKGNYSKPSVVLEKDYHLSYPFLIEDQDQLWMIPETLQSNQIELYHCEEFPLKWKLEKILIKNIRAVDTTILYHNKKYWLFCNIRENEGASTSDELFLFHSSVLATDKWQPHPMNPIVSDVRYSRPAGQIFEYNGHLIRPSQNCAKHYGYGMQLQIIERLTETDYKEVNLQSIHPNWSKDLISTHTLNHEGKLTVIDALVKRRK
nr:hypothetical protein [uncultured Allomuricauda sp.]